MRTKSIVPVLLAAILLAGCGNNKPQTPQQQRDRLIETIGQYDIDTLDARPQDALFSNKVSSVLRHYPELYHASQKVRKAYDNWCEQSLKANISSQTELMDISLMLDEALLGTDSPEALAWPDLSSIDSLYLKLLADEPDLDHKSEIGRTRRAWLNYTGQLQRLLQALPEECRQRYVLIVGRQAQAFQNAMKQHDNTK